MNLHHQQATADSWEPRPGDTVTWAQADGVWVVSGYEDDDTVWIHRPDVRMVPTVVRPGSGLLDLAPYRLTPEHEELVSVADLRPAEQAVAHG